MKEAVRLWDFVLIGLLLAACCSVLLLPKEEGTLAQVSVDGVLIASLALDTDGELPLADGSVVVIRDGAVSLRDATCPDRLCQQMGPISRGGESILCLPNRISIVIVAEEVDGIVG